MPIRESAPANSAPSFAVPTARGLIRNALSARQRCPHRRCPCGKPAAAEYFIL